MVGTLLRREDNSQTPKPAQSPASPIKPVNVADPGSKLKIRLALVGEVAFQKRDDGIPSELEVISKKEHEDDGPANEISKETVESWRKPAVYYDRHGQILHVAFPAEIPATISLESMAEDEFRNKNGLAIVRHGYPADLPAEKLRSDFLRASLQYWETGGEALGIEVDMTPVIVKVLSSGPDLGTADKSLHGAEVPMILIKMGRQFAADDYAVLTNSRFDAVDPKDRVRRTWLLIPYVTNDQNSVPKLPDISGGAVIDEPKAEAWEKLQTEGKRER